MFECTFYAYAYFTICFNALRNQSDFVVYQQEVYKACEVCGFYQQPVDSYPHNAHESISSLYDRGHLASNANFGKCIYLGDTLTPQIIPFNRGTWGVLENRLRKTYHALRILKGCYQKNRKTTGSILTGCYWVVFADTQIKEVGYIDQFAYEIDPALPVSVARVLEKDMISNYTHWNILNPEPTPNNQVPETEIDAHYLIIALASLALLTILVLFLVWVNRRLFTQVYKRLIKRCF